MKFIYLLVSFVVLTTSCMAQESYKIEGKISGLSNNDIIQLIPESHQSQKAIAETTVKDGTFSFSGVQKEPRGVFIIVKNAYGNHHFILDNSHIVLSGSVSKVSNGAGTSYKFNVTQTGSAVTEEYEQKVKPHSDLDKIYDNLNIKYADVIKKMTDARKVKNAALLKEISESEEGKEYAEAEHNFFSSVESTVKNIVMQNKDSWWGPFLMIDMMTYFQNDQKEWYNAMSTAAKNSYYGKLVKDELYPKDLTGTKVPAFKIKDGDKMIDIKDVIKGKKYTIIDFWASWCAPCRREIPNLKRLYGMYSDKGLQIVSISIDKEDAEWKKAYNEEKMPWPSYLDRTGIADLYKVKLIPTMFLIDQNGTLISDKLRGESLAEELQKLFQ